MQDLVDIGPSPSSYARPTRSHGHAYHWNLAWSSVGVVASLSQNSYLYEFTPPPSSRMYRNMFIFLSRRRRSKCCSDNTPDGLGPLAQTLKNNGQQTARLAWAKWPRPFKVGGRNSQAGLGPVAQTFKFVTSKQAWSFTKSRPSGLDF